VPCPPGWDGVEGGQYAPEVVEPRRMVSLDLPTDRMAYLSTDRLVHGCRGAWGSNYKVANHLRVTLFVTTQLTAHLFSPTFAFISLHSPDRCGMGLAVGLLRDIEPAFGTRIVSGQRTEHISNRFHLLGQQLNPLAGQCCPRTPHCPSVSRAAFSSSAALVLPMPSCLAKSRTLT
jgi:hypothetical protein